MLFFTEKWLQSEKWYPSPPLSTNLLKEIRPIAFLGGFLGFFFWPGHVRPDWSRVGSLLMLHPLSGGLAGIRGINGLAICKWVWGGAMGGACAVGFPGHAPPESIILFWIWRADSDVTTALSYRPIWSVAISWRRWDGNGFNNEILEEGVNVWKGWKRGWKVGGWRPFWKAFHLICAAATAALWPFNSISTLSPL